MIINVNGIWYEPIFDVDTIKDHEMKRFGKHTAKTTLHWLKNNKPKHRKRYDEKY